MSRYDLSEGDSEYQPGSNSLVLRNKLGITDPQVMELEETLAYKRMIEASLDSFESDQKLSITDINDLHFQWLGSIYEFAGQYRKVNVSKDGFAFCAAAYIPEQMNGLNTILRQETPCVVKEEQQLSRILAKVHGEFILIHPYRDGNGRIGRWLSSILALQAGFSILNHSAETSDQGKQKYFRAVRRYAVDPSLLEQWFEDLLRRV